MSQPDEQFNKLARVQRGRVSNALLIEFGSVLSRRKSELLEQAITKYRQGENSPAFFISFFAGYVQLQEIEETLMRDIRVMNKEEKDLTDANRI